MAQEAERLGYDVALAPEGYRCDGATLLGWVAARTERIDLASAVFQMLARTPVMTAVTAATLDALSCGRFRLGLGISNAYVSEGWCGVRFDKPLERTREYVEIVRTTLRREPVRYHGKIFELPLPGGRGEAFQLSIEPVRPSIPIYLAAVGPRSLELAGEIADGWLGAFCSPKNVENSVRHLGIGRKRGGRDMHDLDVIASVPMVVGSDLRAAAAPVRQYVARFVSLGHRGDNFYYRLLEQMGYAHEAAEVQDRCSVGDYSAASAAVPLEFIDRTSLIGPVDRIAAQMAAYAEAGVTTLAISALVPTLEGRIQALRDAAQALDRSGVGDGHACVRIVHRTR